MSSISSSLFGANNPMAGSSISPSMYSGGPSLPSISGSMSNPTSGNNVNGSTPSYAGQSLTSPALPTFTGSGDNISDLTTYQNQANQANASRFNQGAGVLAGGYNQALGSISNAMNTSNQYQQANLNQLAGQQNQFQNSIDTDMTRLGLGSSVGDMNNLSSNVASLGQQNVNEMANARTAGLLQNQGSLQAQGGQGMANYLGSANIQAPNMSLYAPLMQQASQQQALQKQRQASLQSSAQQAMTQADNYLNNSGNQGNSQAYTNAENQANAITNANNQASVTQEDQQRASLAAAGYGQDDSQELAQNWLDATGNSTTQQTFTGADGSTYDQWGNPVQAAPAPQTTSQGN